MVDSPEIGLPKTALNLEVCDGESEIVIVQWCVKGLALPDDATAQGIIDAGAGLLCNWWRDKGTIPAVDFKERLTVRNLEFHVNHFAAFDTAIGREFRELSPFISLSAGVVERDSVARTNRVHDARQVAIWFGTNFGECSFAYVFPCWLVVSPREAVELEMVAEEVRDLNTYRRYSAFQTEGEIVAKIRVPDNQILGCERWDLDPGGEFILGWTYANQRFESPERLSNVRDLI